MASEFLRFPYRDTLCWRLMTHIEPPRRPTARVLLLDPQDRILLMKGRLPGAGPGAGVWFTPGGGVEPGESLHAAAAREVLEETGFAEVVFGEVVWRREGVLALAAGPRLMDEHYILARGPAAEPSRHGWRADEQALIEDIRWWSVDELAATRDPVAPPDLARLLVDLLTEGPPKAPRRIAWR